MHNKGAELHAVEFENGVDLRKTHGLWCSAREMAANFE
jgi:hypothetical protein